jgi:hypothetical protein
MGHSGPALRGREAMEKDEHQAYLFTDSDRELVYDPSQPWVIRGRHVEVDHGAFPPCGTEHDQESGS